MESDVYVSLQVRKGQLSCVDRLKERLSSGSSGMRIGQERQLPSKASDSSLNMVRMHHVV